MDISLFFQNCLIAAEQVVILYLIVAVGFIADKKKVFTEKTARAANDLLFYIITPCVIINSFLTTEFSAETSKGFLLAALGG
ncbi:MAG: AEC family transporter, partial [Clostridia bacterium]|nr:AEC family transporter [Clostridia bacterium]